MDKDEAISFVALSKGLVAGAGGAGIEVHGKRITGMRTTAEGKKSMDSFINLN